MKSLFSLGSILIITSIVIYASYLAINSSNDKTGISADNCRNDFNIKSIKNLEYKLNECLKQSNCKKSTKTFKITKKQFPKLYKDLKKEKVSVNIKINNKETLNKQLKKSFTTKTNFTSKEYKALQQKLYKDTKKYCNGFTLKIVRS